MMLRTSSNSINPALQMFKITLRKNLGLIILISAIALLVCPAYMSLEFASREISVDYYMGKWVKGIAIFATSIGLGGTFIYNLIDFSYMFSKKSSDVFHSIPLTRGELLFSRAISGLISALIPVITLFVSISGVCAVYGYFDMYITEILLSFVMVLVSVIVFWTLSLVFVVCSGSAFNYSLSYLGINLGIFAIAAIFNNILDTYLVGYIDNFPIFEFFSPIYYCFKSIIGVYYNETNTQQIIRFFIIAIALSAVFLLFTYYLYKRRKAERAGSAYAYRFIYVICGLIVSFSGGYGLGIIFSKGGTDNFLFWFFASIGSILCAVAYGAITNRSFKGFKRSILLGGVSITCLALLVVIMIIDPIGFSRRIPKKENIQCVTLNVGDIKEINYTDNNLPIDLHKRIVEEKLSVADSVPELEKYTSVYLEYTLKNGIKVKRSYWVAKSEIENEIYGYYSSDEHFNMIYDKLEKREDDRVFVRYINHTRYYLGAISKQEFIELLEIYREEISTNPDIVNNCGDRSFCFVANWDDYTAIYSGDILYMSNKTVKTKAYINSLIKQQKLTP